MDNFIAIDVETANASPASICSIGAVKVRDGVIVDRRYALVRPEPDYYAYFCSKVHGLSDADTWNAPTFGTVWGFVERVARRFASCGAQCRVRRQLYQTGLQGLRARAA